MKELKSPIIKKLSIAQPYEVSKPTPKKVSVQAPSILERRFPLRTGAMRSPASLAPSLKIEKQAVDRPEGIVLKTRRSDSATDNDSTVRTTSRKLRNGSKYQLFTSQGTAAISSPEHITTHKGNLGDLFVHKHTEGLQMWFMGIRGWRKIVGKGDHPSEAGYVIHITKDIPSPAEDAKAAKDLGRRPSSRWKGAPTRTHGRSDSFHDLREDRSGEDDGEDDPFFPFSNAKSGSDEKPSRPLGEFSLINTLNWDSDHYTTIQNALHEVSKRYFDTTLPLHEQNAYAKKCYIREALNLYPFLADYPSAWPAEEFAAMYLKNTSYVYRQKRRKRLSDIRRIKKPSQVVV
ncbi:hypothetical protein EST38_g11398 [Candolleomyces aberdarensis]|uniref:Uncharacterized protein n=1 Tax=Candolleomyces aberdarensis TaxID=2316362 RepID=A0A4Q2D507_9AGAR|nr:hypothetical protein EST38_g11398 [Candolleomyces aberdarensis]